jgi:membrane-bound metal-dependent hydrolase YbcI (DUF457 family)
MNTVTHALVPVLLVRFAAGRRPVWMGRWCFIQIGLAGALPDLLNPHLTLEERMNGWAHGLPCWVLFSVILLGISVMRRGWVSRRMAGVLSLAYLLHLICDAVAGGINWFYPLGDLVWGAYWVDALLWIPIDVVLMLTAYGVFRWSILRERAKGERPQAGVYACEDDSKHEGG